MTEEVEQAMSEEDVAELVELYLQRTRSGEQGLTISSFAAQYPACEQELLELLSAVEAVEKLSRSGGGKIPVQENSFPEQLGGYTLIEKIGRGGMGTVYRARQESLQREVAIKILAPSWNDDEQHCAAFEKEARVIAQLRHTNIVEIYGAGHEQGYRYYVMGLVDGEVLSPKGIRRVFPLTPFPRAIAQIALQAAKALSYAHQHNILHRDIKPGNLMLDKEGLVHVTDFGIATVLNAGEAAPHVTQSNDGTLRYMAPERLMKGCSSYATDQYALGLTLYEILLGKPAFYEVEPGTLIRRICQGPITPLVGYGDLGAIINKSVRFEADERYASMPDMIDDIMRYLAGEPIHARRIGLWRRYTLWLRRQLGIAIWIHIALLLVIALFTTIGISYLRVSNSLQHAEQERTRAQRNAEIAGDAITRIIGTITTDDNKSFDEESEFDVPSKADIRLIQELLPYYNEIIEQGAGSDEHIADASYSIGSIAMRAGKFHEAASEFARAIELTSPHSAKQLRAKNGRISALLSQRTAASQREAFKLIREVFASAKKVKDTDSKLEILTCYQTAFHLLHVRPQSGAQSSAQREQHQQLLQSCAKLLFSLLKEEPDNARLLLTQAYLLSELHNPKQRELFAPNGESPLSIINAILEKNSNDSAAKAAYIRLSLRRPREAGNNTPQGTQPQVPQPQPFDKEKAAEYAQSLLASNPSDSTNILLYLRTRLHYVNEIARTEDQLAAELEHERTLGVLELLLSRSDITPETRKSLLTALNMRPSDSAVSELEKEWRKFMQDQNAKHSRQLRERLEKASKLRPARKRPSGGMPTRPAGSSR